MTVLDVSTDSAVRWRTEIANYNSPHTRLRAVAALLARDGCTSVADIGCASGVLRDLLPPHARYHGVDFIAGLEPRPGDSVTVVDLNGVDLPPIELDVQWVVCSGILEYVRDLQRFLEWLRLSNVRPDVQFLLTYFNDTHISVRLRRLRGKEVVGHADWVPLLSRQSLVARLTEADFRVTEEFDFGREIRPSPPYQHLTEAPRLYRADRRSALLAHQWIFIMNRHGTVVG